MLRSFVAACIALATFAGPAPRSFAADGSWNGNFAGNWTTGTNWLGGVIPGSTTATNSTDIATFGFTLTAGRIVTVDTNRNVAGIIFSNTSAFGYTLSSGNLLLSNGGVIQSTTINGAHTDTISSAIAIQGVGGSGTFTAGATSASSLLSIGAVTGVSTAGNTTTLTLNGDNTGANAITGIIGNGAAGGRLAVVKSGNGAWRLSGVNTFSGGLALNSGTLQLGADAALGSGTFTIAGGAIDVTAARTTTNNNAQAWNGDFTFAGSNTLDLGTGAVAMNASRTVTVNASTLTVGGVISGAGFGLTKQGAGTLRLNGGNTFSGGITLSSGTLSLGNNAALGTGTFTISGGWLDVAAARTTTNNNAQAWNGDFTFVGSNTLDLGTGAVALGASLTVTVNASTLTVSGVITGAGAGLTKAGQGTLALTGSNTYSGPARITGGVVSINGLTNAGVAGPLGAATADAANLVIDGGTLTITGSSSTDRLFTLGPNGATLNTTVNTASFTNTGAIAFSGSGSRTLTLTEGNRAGFLATSIGDPTGGSTSIVKLGGSTDTSGWTLSGSNSYTGETTLGAWGSLTANNAYALGNTSKINFKTTGAATQATVLAFAVAPAMDYSTVFSTAPNQIYRISMGSGVATTFNANLASVGGVFEKLGSGTLTLGGSNSFSSASVSLGTLLIASAAALGSGPVSLGDTTTLASTSATPITISNAITGTANNGRITFGSTTGTGNLTFTGPMALSNVGSFGMTLAGLTSVDIQGPISGSSTSYSLTIGAGRTLRLGGDNSGWNVNPSASTGTLILGHRNALGTGTMTISGVTLQASTDLSGANAVRNELVVGNDSTISGSNSITLSGNVTLSSAGSRTLTSSITNGSLVISGTAFLQESSSGLGRIPVLAGSGNTVFSGPIVNGGTAGSSGLTITNTGLTTLSGTNTYTGATTVSGGALLLSTTAAVTGSATRSYTVNAAAAVATGFALDQTFLGRIVNTSAGAVALGANSANNLDFSSAGANLTAASLGAVGTGTWAYTGTLTPNGTAYRLGGGGGTIDFQSPLTGASNTLTIGGPTTGLGGTVILSSTTNSYGGATTVQRGTLRISSLTNAGSNSSTGTNGTINLGSGTAVATLQYVGSGNTSNRTISITGSSGAIVDASGSGALDMTSGTISTTFANNLLTLTGSNTATNSIGMIDGTGLNVKKTGPGTWRVGAGNYGGQLQILNGTIVSGGNVGAVNNVSTLGYTIPIVGDSTATATGTAALLLEGGLSIQRQITVDTLADGASQVAVLGATGTGVATFGNNSTPIRLGRSVTLQASDSATASFSAPWKDSDGNDNPVVGYTIGSAGNAGVVRLESVLSDLATGVSIVNGTAQLFGNGGEQIYPATPVTLGSTLGAATLDLNGLSQSLSRLTFAGNSGSVTTGTAANGMLRLVNSGSVAVSGTGHAISSLVDLVVPSTLNIEPASALTVSNVISSTSGAMGLTKTGLGKLTLTGNNTYAGTTTVSEGTLVVNGSLGGGNLSVAAAATLMGSGTIGGAATIAGIHSPGNSPGIETFSSDLSYTGGSSQVIWELWNNTISNSPLAYDQIVVGGNLDFAGATSLSLDFGGTGVGSVDWNDSFWATNQTWTLFDVAGTTTNFGNFSLTNSPASWLDASGLAFASSTRKDNTFTVSQQGSDVLIQYTVVVPEPASLALAGIGIAAAAWASRRRPRAGEDW